MNRTLPFALVNLESGPLLILGSFARYAAGRTRQAFSPSAERPAEMITAIPSVAYAASTGYSNLDRTNLTEFALGEHPLRPSTKSLPSTYRVDGAENKDLADTSLVSSDARSFAGSPAATASDFELCYTIQGAATSNILSNQVATWAAAITADLVTHVSRYVHQAFTSMSPKDFGGTAFSVFE